MQNRFLHYIMNTSDMEGDVLMTEREELEMWKKMYLRTVRGMEDAIQVLTRAEEEAEALYIEAGLPGESRGDGKS